METLQPASLTHVHGGAPVNGPLGKLVNEVLHADASGRYRAVLGQAVMEMRRRLREELVSTDYNATWKRSGARKRGFEGVSFEDMLAKAKSLTRSYP
jgi:hypothetical protein